MKSTEFETWMIEKDIPEKKKGVQKKCDRTSPPKSYRHAWLKCWTYICSWRREWRKRLRWRRTKGLRFSSSFYFMMCVKLWYFFTCAQYEFSFSLRVVALHFVSSPSHQAAPCEWCRSINSCRGLYGIPFFRSSASRAFGSAFSFFSRKRNHSLSTHTHTDTQGQEISTAIVSKQEKQHH